VWYLTVELMYQARESLFSECLVHLIFLH
jgi:hypothetical protein